MTENFIKINCTCPDEESGWYSAITCAECIQTNQKTLTNISLPDSPEKYKRKVFEANTKMYEKYTTLVESTKEEIRLLESIIEEVPKLDDALIETYAIEHPHYDPLLEYREDATKWNRKYSILLKQAEKLLKNYQALLNKLEEGLKNENSIVKQKIT